VDADGGIGRPGAAGHEDQAWRAGQLAIGLAHEGRATFVAADDEAQPVADVVHGIEHVEVALSGNAECMRGALGQQAGHQECAA